MADAVHNISDGLNFSVSPLRAPSVSELPRTCRPRAGRSTFAILELVVDSRYLGCCDGDDGDDEHGDVMALLMLDLR